MLPSWLAVFGLLLSVLSVLSVPVLVLVVLSVLMSPLALLASLALLVPCGVCVVRVGRGCGVRGRWACRAARQWAEDQNREAG